MRACVCHIDGLHKTNKTNILTVGPSQSNEICIHIISMPTKMSAKCWKKKNRLVPRARGGIFFLAYIYMYADALFGLVETALINSMITSSRVLFSVCFFVVI